MEKQVTITAEERQEFEEFKAEKARKEAQQKAKDDREAYRTLVDETIHLCIPMLEGISNAIKGIKTDVLEKFSSILEMKAGIITVKDDQRSHTFTHTDGTARITIGQYITDAYLDTVGDGIAMVKEYIQSLAKDDESRALVNGIMRLLSKDKEGNLKASRVLQLRKMADDSQNERFIEGVRIIEEAYRPAVSKTYLKVEVKDKNNAWKIIPLGMTEA